MAPVRMGPAGPVLSGRSIAMSTTIFRPRTRPAAPIVVVGPGHGLAVFVRLVPATIRVWTRRSRQRRALRELAERGDRDHLLDDIGVTPEQARRACAKWFWQP